MSYYKDPVESEIGLTPASLLTLYRDYFPYQFWKNFKPICGGCRNNFCRTRKYVEHTEPLLARLKHHFRMFGTPSELAELLQTFSNFPGSHEAYRLPYFESYETVPVLYYNHTKTKSFIHKKDVFVLLQDLPKETTTTIGSFPHAMVCYFLKSFNENLGFITEFMAWSEDMFRSIRRQYEEHFNTNYRGPRNPPPKNYEECLERAKQILRTDAIDKRKFSVISELMCEVYDGDEENILEIDQLLVLSDAVIGALSEIVIGNQFHLPASKQSEQFKCPPILRLFVDGDNKFAIYLEMDLIEEKRPANKNDLCYLRTTCDEQTAMDFIAKNPDVELVITPIVRTPHRVVSIGQPTTENAILATDALFQTIFELAFGWKVFQNCQGKRWKALVKFVSVLEQKFHMDEYGPYFISVAMCSFSKEASEFFVGLEGSKNLKLSTKNEFSLNLQDQLVHLELDKTFPNILEIAKKHELQEKCHRVSDVVNAIQQLARVGFLEKFPKFARFIHNQEACHQILFCKVCDAKKAKKEKEKIRKKNKKTQNLEDVPKEQKDTVEGSSSSELEKLPQPAQSSRSSSDPVSNQLPKEPSPSNLNPIPELEKLPQPAQNPEDVVISEEQKDTLEGSGSSELEKEAMKKVEEVEKEVRKLDRLVDESKIREREEKYQTEIAELKEKLEKSAKKEKELDQLKVEMTKVKQDGKDAVRRNQKKREANWDLRRQLASLEAENAEQKLLIDELCELQEQKSRESTLDRVLRELQSQKSEIETDDPAKKAKETVAEIVNLSMQPELRHWAQEELKLFNYRLARRTRVLDSTIATLENLTPIPDLPTLPEGLLKEHAEIRDNLEVRESDCYICLVTTKERCESCGAPVHKKCQESWKHPGCVNPFSTKEL